MAQLPDELMRPPMMAIGDSMFNGVRSLSIDNELAQRSAPAQVATALGIRHRFFCPDYERPVLINAETWVRWFPDLSRIRDDYKSNARHWLTRPKSNSGRQAFDNVAIAGTTFADLTDDTAAKAHNRIAKRLKKHGKKALTTLSTDVPISDLFLDLNTRFVLNPMGIAALEKKSQVAQVAMRRPERLLVNIGANNGLWNMAFAADPTGKMCFDGLDKLAKQLNALPAEVKHIYVNNLVLPSTVPNLMPAPPDSAHYQKPSGGKYHKRYENRVGFEYGSMTGGQLKTLDQRVIAANKKIRDTLRAAFADKRRLHFVDIATLLKIFDSKHKGRTNASAVVLKNGKRLRNYMLDAHPLAFGNNFREGGLAGFDGMHPTVVGYAKMAQLVLDAMVKHEGIGRPKIDLDRAYANDSLLTDVPGRWNILMWIWRDIRRAQASNEPSAADAETGDGGAAELMACITSAM